jgi:hypothetical protein
LRLISKKRHAETDAQRDDGERRTFAALDSSAEPFAATFCHACGTSSRAKAGRIEIEYYGNDDLQRILSAIGLPDEA